MNVVCGAFISSRTIFPCDFSVPYTPPPPNIHSPTVRRLGSLRHRCESSSYKLSFCQNLCQSTHGPCRASNRVKPSFLYCVCHLWLSTSDIGVSRLHSNKFLNVLFRILAARDLLCLLSNRKAKRKSEILKQRRRSKESYI